MVAFIFNNNYVIIMSLVMLSRDLYQTLRILTDFVTDKISKLNHGMYEIKCLLYFMPQFLELTRKLEYQSYNKKVSDMP